MGSPCSTIITTLPKWVRSLCNLGQHLLLLVLTQSSSAHLVPISFFQLFQTEDFLVNYRMNIIRFDRLVHLLKLLPAAYRDSSHNASLHPKL
jgi:hypothetical protein